MKKAIIALILLGAAGGGGYWFYSQSQKPDPPTINYAAVSRGNIVDTVSATGALEPVERVDVGAQVSGVILELSADYNDVVRKGQLLARLDPKLIDTQILQAEANLIRSETDVARNKVQLEDAERKYARTKELFDKGIQNKVDFENADLQLKSANAALQSSLASLKQTSASLEQQKVNREHTEIYSPIDGIVVARRVDVGQTVNAGQQAPILYNLAADLAEMRVMAGIDEADIGRVRADQHVTFNIDAYQNEVFTGTVQSVRLEARMQQNVVTYQAVITVPNPGLKLRPGMTANIRIEIARKNDVIRVPNAATRFRPTTDMYVALGLEPPDAGRGRGGPGREGGRGGDLTAAAGPASGPAQPAAAPAGAPPPGTGQQPSGGRQSGERGSSGGAGMSGGGGRGGGNGENGSSGSSTQTRNMTPEERERMRNMTPEERELMMRGRGGRGGSGRGGSGRGGFGRGGDGGSRGGRDGMNAREGQGRQGGQRGGSTLTAAELAATRGVTTIDKLFPPLPSVERQGRVWTLKKEGEKQILTSHNVRLGISDGTVTELVQGDVTEGQQLITTIVTAQVRPTPGMFGPQGGNPFMQQPGRGGPGGGRGPGGGGGGPQGGGGGGGGGGGNRGGGGGGGGGGRGGGF